MESEKTVYLLIGAKGSGKTYIGEILEKSLGVRFLSVEPLLIAHIALAKSPSDRLEYDGYDIEESAIDEILLTQNEVITESTGSSEHLLNFIRNLRTKYTIRLMRVLCPLEECFKRVKSRNSADQFYVPDDRINSINEKTIRLELDWDLEIDNSGPALDADICAQFESVRGSASSV